MKKLFALVLVFAMALAIAVPAMATGWDPIKPDEDPATAISFKLYGLKTEENTAVLGGLYEELTDKYPLVKGTEVHFMVDVAIPAVADLSAANLSLLGNRGLTVKVDTTNIVIDTVEFDIFDVDTGKLLQEVAKTTVNDDTWSVVLGNASRGYEYKFEFWGSGVKGGVDGTVVASAGYYNAWDGSATRHTFLAWGADGELGFTAVADDNAYNAAKAQGYFWVYNGEFDTDASDWIQFPVYNGMVNDDNGPAIYFHLAEDGKVADKGIYSVTRSTASNGSYIFRINANSAIGVTDTTGAYAELKAAFDAILAKLGFSYDGQNAMTAAHFVKYFGTIDEISEKLVYPAGYVTVTNPEVEPPQTGDATTVVGFVMIALALVAAAIVTVKKVRA